MNLFQFSCLKHNSICWFLFTLISLLATTSVCAEEPPQNDWKAGYLDWKIAPVDLSFLNANEKPAGKRGFVKAQGEKLVFEDGTTAKFWGVNIAAYTVFKTPKKVVAEQAKKLSAMGVNLVRIHHIDSPWVNPNVFEKKANNTQSLNPEAMESIDWWIKCLKEEGIYVWLDLHVQRNFLDGDGISDFNEIAKYGKADLKGYNYVNASIQKSMQAFNAAYISHLNPYTKLAYKDEPAIMGLLITNENDLTQHFVNVLLPDKPAKQHSLRYMLLADEFAAKNRFKSIKAWRPWEHGPSMVFLNNLEHEFNANMIAHLRALGVKVPLATTSAWGFGSVSALPALSSGDVIDAHAYQKGNSLKTNPLTSAQITNWLAAAQVVGKPLTVSEWNADPFPDLFRQDLPMWVATQASFQGWDAMMLYAYSQSVPRNNGGVNNWDSIYDPSLMATMPAAALMYRRGDVAEANKTYILNLGDGLFEYYKGVNPGNSAFIRTASELGKLQIAMPNKEELLWLKESSLPNKENVYDNPNQSLLATGTTKVTNPSYMHDWQKGVLTIDTDKTQALIGNADGQTVTLKDVTFTSQTPNVAMVVQSIDNQLIHSSNNILISFAARALPSKRGVLSEPVIGSISIAAPSGLTLYKRGALQEQVALPTRYENGHYEIKLDASLNTYWLNLKK